MGPGLLAAVAADGAGVRLVAGSAVRAGQRGVSATPRARGSAADGDFEVGIVQAQQRLPVQAKLLRALPHYRPPGYRVRLRRPSPGPLHSREERRRCRCVDANTDLANFLAGGPRLPDAG